ncbi:MAG: hypothetical protein CMH56_03405, partial [Myxococcales bacterium]|nr:hypothetical protein [Myxococcales bacterium]
MKSRLLTRLALFLSLSAMACDTGPKEGEEHIYYAEKLNHEDKKVRENAMKNLSQLKDKRSVPGLNKALGNGHAEIKPELVKLVRASPSLQLRLR